MSTPTTRLRREAYGQCPLYPQKRTLELSLEMSALCQKRTSDSGSFAMFAAIRRDEEEPGRRSAAKLLSKGEVRCQIWFASYAPNRPQSGQWLSRRGLTI